MDSKIYKKLLPALVGSFLFSQLLLFGDNENYSGQDISARDFSNRSLKNSIWESANATDVNFTNSDLTSADFFLAGLRNADFTGAVITNADFGKSKGLTKEQLYSTASYKNKDLTGIGLSSLNITGWDFSGQNITNADFSGSDGFTKEQLYSTASYKNKNLAGIDFSDNDVSGWDFSGQNLSSARLGSTLTNADFTDAIITNANFSSKTRAGFTKEQLYSTASYKNKNLSGIKLGGNFMNDWDFSNQNLQNAFFEFSSLINANMSGADLRGSRMVSISSDPIYRNTIRSDGRIENFSMTSPADSLLIRKYEPGTSDGALISAKLDTSSIISGGAVLTLERGADFELVDYYSTLTVAQGSAISINTDASSSTSFSILDASSLIFEDGAILEINLEGIFTTGDSISFVVFDWENGGSFEVIGDFVKDESIFLSLNGEKFDGEWNYNIDNNKFIINISQVPEPATCAAMFGIVAMFFVYNRRKTN